MPVPDPSLLPDPPAPVAGDPPVFVLPDRFLVSAIPPNDIAHRDYAIYIDHRGRGRWIVTRGWRPEERLTAKGEWRFDWDGHETLHDLATAVQLARAAAPNIVVAGQSARERPPVPQRRPR